MGIKLASMLAKTRVITVKWDDENEAEVSYFPNVVTPELMEQVAEAAEQENMSVLGVMLEPVLDWWDLLDEKDKRIPTDKATIGTLPLKWLTAVNEAIQEDQNPPE